MAAFAAAGLGVGVSVAACGSTGHVPAAAGPPGGSGYSYYRSMMGRLYVGQRFGEGDEDGAEAALAALSVQVRHPVPRS